MTLRATRSYCATVLKRLVAKRKTHANAWLCECPGCGHATAFRVAAGPGRSVYLHCHAGCSPSTYIAQLKIPFDEVTNVKPDFGAEVLERIQPQPRGQPDRAVVLTPGTHVLGDGETLDVTNTEFADDLLKALPAGAIYRRAGVPGELVGQPLAFHALTQDRTRLLTDVHVRIMRHYIGKDEKHHLAYLPSSKDHAGLVLSAAVSHPSVCQLDHLVPHPVFSVDWRLSPAGHSGTTYYDEPECLKGLTPERNHEAIRGVLDDTLKDFPFATYADKDSYIGLLLTPLIRPAIIGNVPMHCITSPIERTGKTKLASEVLGGIYIGAPVPAMQITGSEDERDKRLLSLLLAGRRLVHFDNVNDMLDSPVLASLLTTAFYEGRILGVSKSIEVPNYLVTVSTGNNLRATGEMAKRIVPIQLLPTQDHPEQRTEFKHPDIAAYVVQRRRAILECLAGMVLNWVDAGQPLGTLPMGGFDKWAAVVGGILNLHGFTRWLCGAAAWRESVDDFGADLKMFVTAWKLRDHLTSPGQLFELAKDTNVFPWVRSKPSEQGQLMSFSMSVLRKATNRVVCGCRIVTTSSGNNRSYRLVPV